MRQPVRALLDAEVQKKYIFAGQMSGAKAARERPEMNKLLEYAREGDEIYVWRIDRLGRSLVDVVNTVQDITDRGIRLYSIMDGVGPSTSHGRLQLALFASLTQYERELINERVRAGVMAAQARGVKSGKQGAKQSTIETKIRLVRQLLSEGNTADEAAEAVSWSRATLYRYLKKYGADTPTESGEVVQGRGRSQYAAKTKLPARR